VSLHPTYEQTHRGLSALSACARYYFEQTPCLVYNAKQSCLIADALIPQFAMTLDLCIIIIERTAKHPVRPAFSCTYRLTRVHHMLHSIQFCTSGCLSVTSNSCAVMTIDGSLHPGLFLTSSAHASYAITVSCILSLSPAYSQCIRVCKHLPSTSFTQAISLQQSSQTSIM